MARFLLFRKYWFLNMATSEIFCFLEISRPIFFRKQCEITLIKGISRRKIKKLRKELQPFLRLFFLLGLIWRGKWNNSIIDILFFQLSQIVKDYWSLLFVQTTISVKWRFGQMTISVKWPSPKHMSKHIWAGPWHMPSHDIFAYEQKKQFQSSCENSYWFLKNNSRPPNSVTTHP
jgi:hypothetical protein